jgi:hypothetical protein
MAQRFLFPPAIRLPQFVELARALNPGAVSSGSSKATTAAA